jgi:hypothetical protein
MFDRFRLYLSTKEIRYCGINLVQSSPTYPTPSTLKHHNRFTSCSIPWPLLPCPAGQSPPSSVTLGALL